MSETLIFEKNGPIGRLTLNRPEKYNSFTRELALSMQEALKRCRDEEGIRALGQNRSPQRSSAVGI